MNGFSLTAKQREANAILGGPYRHILLEGGSRSGKTFLFCRAIVHRACRASRSRHAIFRFRFNSCKTKIFMDTLPNVFERCYPGLPYNLNREDWFVRLPNGSEIWCGGLDDKQRTEKVLGGEYATLFLNECSEIPWSSRNMAITRLAQAAKCDDDGSLLQLRAYYDQNPPKRSHWTYRLFHQKVDPETRQPLADASLYARLQMNPADNQANLPPGYIEEVLGGMSSRMQRRFLKGEYADDTANSLFPQEYIDRFRIISDDLPDWQRIVVAVDPSGARDENSDGDAIGIVVAALGTDGYGYVLEDLTLTAGPATWGNVAVHAFERHRADRIVAEGNYGGAMVRHVIETARPRTPFTMVNATRGKVVRAEPIAALVEKGRVRLVGYFPELEDELAGFTTGGYVGEGSPNRADAFVWAMTALFPGIVSERREPTRPQPPRMVYAESGLVGNANWMGA